MSAIFVVQKVGFPERDRSANTHKLMLVCSALPKNPTRETFHTVYWPKRILHAANILYKDGVENIVDSSHLALNFNKSSVCFISIGKILQIFEPK